MRRRDARGRSGARSILLPHRWRLVILAIVWLKAEIGERGGGEGATPRRGRWKGAEGGKGGSRRRCGGRPTVTRTAVMSLAGVWKSARTGRGRGRRRRGVGLEGSGLEGSGRNCNRLRKVRGGRKGVRVRGARPGAGAAWRATSSVTAIVRLERKTSGLALRSGDGDDNARGAGGRLEARPRGWVGRGAGEGRGRASTSWAGGAGACSGPLAAVPVSRALIAVPRSR